MILLSDLVHWNGASTNPGKRNRRLPIGILQ